MRILLEGRKAALEAEIAQRHRAARVTGTTANVTMLSATLRAVKRQTATTMETPAIEQSTKTPQNKGCASGRPKSCPQSCPLVIVRKRTYLTK
jgi:hypothetical protein